MSFKIVILPPYQEPEWPSLIEQAVEGVIVKYFDAVEDSLSELVDADAVYGTIPEKFFSYAKKLKWLAAPQAGLGGRWFYQKLVESDIIVTNIRGVYNDHLSAHIMAFVMMFARKFHKYFDYQRESKWEFIESAVYLPDSIVIVIGVGNIGSEVAKLCKAFGMKVFGVDPCVDENLEYIDELYQPEMLDSILGKADFVIITTPETPKTIKMFDERRLRLLKKTAYLINTGRGSSIVLDDLVKVLQQKKFAGVGLDVFEIEPLPSEHPLWKMSNVIITPHIAGTMLDKNVKARRTKILIENCKRFSKNKPLINVVDKRNWF